MMRQKQGEGNHNVKKEYLSGMSLSLEDLREKEHHFLKLKH